MSVRVLLVSAASACALALSASTAPAQQPPIGDDAVPGQPDAGSGARAHYNAGTKAFADRRFVEAALNFEAAAAEKPNPIALYTAALSWEQANVPERAADDYTRALAAPGLPADKVGLAKERLASLEGVLGAVSVTAPDGWRAQLDANTELPTPATLHAAAGVHTLSARNGGGAIQRRPVVLERGQTAKLDLATAPPPPAEEPKKDTTPPPPAPAPAPSPPAAGWRRPVGFTAIGVGAATLLAGVVLGIEALDARDAYNATPSQAGYDHATGLATWTDVAFVAGGVIAAGGVALVLWPTSRRSAEAPGRPETGLRVGPTLGGLIVMGGF
jgi:hypothetical protein